MIGTEICCLAFFISKFLVAFCFINADNYKVNYKVLKSYSLAFSNNHEIIHKMLYNLQFDII